MKIGGLDVKRATEGEIYIPTPKGEIYLRVKATPLDFDIDDIFPMPKPPRVKARRTNGHIEKERDGSIVWDVNLDEPHYKATEKRISNVRLAMSFAKVTASGSGDGCVDFEAPLPSDDSVDEEGWLAIYKEIVATGMTDGDLNLVIKKSLQLSNQTSEVQEKVLGNFSQEEDSLQD